MSVVYLSHARVRETQLVPVDELVARFQHLAGQFPTNEFSRRRENLDDWTRTIETAMAIVAGLPPGGDLYHHGGACPCSQCCARAYRLLSAHIEDYFHTKPRRAA